MNVDRGPSNFTDPTLRPCPWCGQPTNYLTQVVKYVCNSCRQPIHFYHHAEAGDITQTAWVEPIKGISNGKS